MQNTDSLKIVRLERKEITHPKTGSAFISIGEGARSEYTRAVNIHFGLPLCQVDDEEVDGFLRAQALYRGNYEVHPLIEPAISYFAAIACSFGQFYGLSEKTLQKKISQKELPLDPASLEAALESPITADFFGLRRVIYSNKDGAKEAYIMPAIRPHY